MENKEGEEQQPQSQQDIEMGGIIDKEESKDEEEYVIDETISPLENLRALGYIIHKETPTDLGKLR